MNCFSNLLRQFSAERTDIENSNFSYFFFQHQKVYSFCIKYSINARILELGSGSGYGTYRLSKKAKFIHGIDKDKDSVAIAQKKYGSEKIKFEVCTIEKLSQQRKYDVVISLQVIEHLPDPTVLIRKAKSSLKKGGILILSTPNKLIQSYNENPYHYKEFSAEELLLLISQYFKRTIIYGLSGDTIIKKHEHYRKKQVIKILSLDILNLRRFIPRYFRQLVFNLASYISRYYLNKHDRHTLQIDENNFQITKKNISEALDLIAVAYI